MFDNVLQACTEIFERIEDRAAVYDVSFEEIAKNQRNILLMTYRIDRTMRALAKYLGVPDDELRIMLPHGAVVDVILSEEQAVPKA